MRFVFRFASVAVAVCAGTGMAAAGSGDLDPSFGSAGIARIQLGAPRYANDLALGSKGEIFVAGTLTEGTYLVPGGFVLKLDGKGAPDASFGAGGVARLDLAARAKASKFQRVHARSDGGAVVTGWVQLLGSAEDYLVAAFLPDGKPDASFGRAGWSPGDVAGGTETPFAGVATARGQFVVSGVSGGNSYLSMYGFTAGGVRDNSFGTSGRVLTEIDESTPGSIDLAVDAKGRLLTLGSFQRSCSETTNLWHLVLRHLKSGIVDGKFGVQGRYELCLGAPANFNAMASAKNRVYLAGASGNDLVVVRLDAKGRLDKGFADKGLARWTLTTPWPTGILVDPQGRIVVAGSFGAEAFVARLRKDGKPDTTFGTQGIVRIDAGSGDDVVAALRRQSDGRLLALGAATSAPNGIYLVRLQP